MNSEPSECKDCTSGLTDAGADLRTCIAHGSLYFSLVCDDEERLAVHVGSYRQDRKIVGDGA